MPSQNTRVRRRLAIRRLERERKRAEALRNKHKEARDGDKRA